MLKFAKITSHEVHQVMMTHLINYSLFNDSHLFSPPHQYVTRLNKKFRADYLATLLVCAQSELLRACKFLRISLKHTHGRHTLTQAHTHTLTISSESEPRTWDLQLKHYFYSLLSLL